jgi:hypothetical protein
MLNHSAHFESKLLAEMMNFFSAECPELLNMIKLAYIPLSYGQLRFVHGGNQLPIGPTKLGWKLLPYPPANHNF